MQTIQMTGDSIVLTGELNMNQRNLNLSNLVIPFSSFVDRDMLMRYHWGLGVGHTYAHGTTSTGLPFRSTSQRSQPLHSRRHDVEGYNYLSGDEIDEGGDADNTETEQDFEQDSECGESHSEEDSESILGDLADMYGCDSDLDALYAF